VASCASDGFGVERRIFETIGGVSDRTSLAYMTEEAICRDRPQEIRRLVILVTRRHVPTSSGIKADGRLKQMALQLNEVSNGVRPGSDGVRRLILGGESAALQSLDHIRPGKRY